jgi:hemerythrin-like domain-containing protein
MAIVQLIMERPGLERSLHCGEFRQPLRLLAADHLYLRQALDGLASLIDNLHATERERTAGSLLDYLSFDLGWLAADQENLLGVLERKRFAPDRVEEIGGAIRDEHMAMRRRLPHVANGLRDLSTGGFPDDPWAFTNAALVFCEFMRLHVDYEDAVLLPLARIVMTEDEIEDFGTDMALRRGMSFA